MYVKLVLLILAGVIILQGAAPAFAAPPTMTATQVAPNSYLVTFSDSQHYNLTVDMLENSIIVKAFNVNTTQSQYFNITTNTTLIMFNGSQQVSQIYLIYKYFAPTISVVSSATTNFVSVKVPTINTYIVVVEENATIVYYSLLSHYTTNFTYPHFDKNSYVNVTQNGSVVASYLVLPYSHLLTFTYQFSNNTFNFATQIYNYKDYSFLFLVNNTTYSQGGILKLTVYYNISVPYGVDGLGKQIVVATFEIYNATQHIYKNLTIPKESPVASSAYKITITPLSNATYEITYISQPGAYLLVTSASGAVIRNVSTNTSGIVYIPISLSPNLAIIKYLGVSEVLQPFPATTQSQPTIIYNVGIPVTDVFLSNIIEGIAIIIAAFFIYNGRRQAKQEIASNKDNTLFDRFKTQSMSNIQYQDPNLLSFLTREFARLDGMSQEMNKLKEQYKELVEEAKNRRGNE
ncbi:MAG: hypothetical protein QXL94_09000 [Candidatus Parvarchaeum sp.]